ncbi:hypothetical protein RRG08_002820 [Elysia crispata]|uniref:Uncharacterized protein n=1 Tax=Elysia crispata TaxID=231223 RepID=A0AAE0XUD5_9GAST|nr:hypothetical protein RRG08_002820 [Elysia crispata]
MSYGWKQSKEGDIHVNFHGVLLKNYLNLRLSREQTYCARFYRYNSPRLTSDLSTDQRSATLELSLCTIMSIMWQDFRPKFDQHHIQSLRHNARSDNLTEDQNFLFSTSVSIIIYLGMPSVILPVAYYSSIVPSTSCQPCDPRCLLSSFL